MNYNLKDSGNRQTFKTGAQRDRPQGKGRYDLISPLALKRIADVLEKGALKYNDRNWELGMPISEFMDSALRHLSQYIEGKRDEDHLGQAFWNLHSALHTEEMILRGNLPTTLFDLPLYINGKVMDKDTKSWWKALKRRMQNAKDHSTARGKK